MRQFITIVITLFIFFNLSIALLIGLSDLRIYSSYFYDKSKGEFLRYDEVDYAIFGNSQSLGGMNQFLLSDLTQSNVQNFSRPGIPMYYTAKRVDQFLKLNKHSKIIIELGTNQVDKKGMIRNLLDFHDKENFIRFLSNNSCLLFFREKLTFFNRTPKKAIVAFVQSIYRPYNLYTGVEFNPSIIEKADKDKLAKYINQPLEDFNVNENIEIDELIKTISNNPNITFVIVRVPEHPIHIELYNNKERFKEISSGLNELANVTFIDYGLYEMDDSFFRDYNHLSKDGMNYFTEILHLDNREFFNILLA